MHRRDRACHWCGDKKTAAWRSPAVLRSATGIAAVALVAVGSWSVRVPARDAISRAFAAASAPIGNFAESAPSPRPVVRLAEASVAPSVAQAPVVQDSVVVAMADVVSEGALEAGAAVDSIRWVPAVARTWVNVRRDASRGGDVVGVIKPSEKAMLGIGRSGWRQVKSPDVIGWVDPRLFESDSLRTRG